MRIYINKHKKMIIAPDYNDRYGGISNTTIQLRTGKLTEAIEQEVGEPHTTFMDVRQEKFEMHGKKINVNPDVIGDFRDMPFESNSFNLVVFDPPHLK